MSEAWVNGKAATLQEAVASAAALLRTSRAPLIAGMGADMAGTRAAILLAEKLGAAFDHMHAGHVLADLAALRSAGAMLTTPNEVRLRADTVLLIGAKAAGYAELARLLSPPHPALSQREGPRKIFALTSGGKKILAPAAFDIHHHVTSGAALTAVVSALHCAVRGKPFGPAPFPTDTIMALAACLREAKFGACLWSADEFEGDPMLPFMLMDLVTALNDTTRFSAVPLTPPGNGAGVAQTAAWMTGFPMRTSFARGYPEHDPWRFDAARLAQAGEADAALWISAYQDAAPDWADKVPLVALTGAQTRLSAPPRVRISVGKPGRDHDGVDLSAETATFAPFAASAPSGLPSVAQILTMIDAELAAGGQA